MGTYVHVSGHGWPARAAPREATTVRVPEAVSARPARPWAEAHGGTLKRAPLLILILCLAVPAVDAEIIDRIAVSVGNRVITGTDLDREIRITALLNGEKADFSPANKRRTAARMVDQRLVRSELEASRYLLPSAAEGDAALKELKSRFADEAAYRRALAEQGIDEDDLKTRLVWQLTLVRFLDVRFRPGIQVGDEEIRSYFNEHLRADLQKANPGKSLSVDDYRDTIEQTLIGQAVNQQVEQWLATARRRTRIVFHDEVFR